MAPMSSSLDDFTQSRDFKLCGFFSFVVSVVDPSPIVSHRAESPSPIFPVSSTVFTESGPEGLSGEDENVGFSSICKEELPNKVSTFYSRRRAVLEGTSGEVLKNLFGAECWLTGEGLDVQFYTKRGFVLSPILDTRASNKHIVDNFEGTIDSGTRDEVCSTPPCKDTPLELSSTRKQAASRKKRKRQGGYVDDGVHLLSNVQMLTVRNGVRVKGHVVRISSKGNQVRAVILLDLYLPSFLWSGRNYWKPNAAFTTILHHLSCDWEERRRALRIEGQVIDLGYCKEIWDTGNCQVLSCNLHRETTEAVQESRFDMHAIFKSLPSLTGEQVISTTIFPERQNEGSFCDIPDTVIMSILSMLSPRDLQSVACTCRHLHGLVQYIMPCMNLKLFPHQQAAVLWMLQRELHPVSFPHPLYKDLQTEDGFHFYLNCLTGDLSPEAPSSITDFRGGLFCDEPGLGKTVTALCLILKTQGSLATPPPGVHVNWCEHRSGDQYGYYEIRTHRFTSVLKRGMELKAKRNKIEPQSPTCLSSHYLTSAAKSVPSRKRRRDVSSSPLRRISFDAGPATRASSAVKRKLTEEYANLQELDNLAHGKNAVLDNRVEKCALYHDKKGSIWQEQVWVQCDACSKWRKIDQCPDEGLAWFCNMNKDPLYQSCSDPEEDWGSGLISSLPGFHKVGGPSCLEQNVIHFANVLKDYALPRCGDTQAALIWLANMESDKLEKMSTIGVVVPSSFSNYSQFSDYQPQYEVIFQKFGLVQKRNGKGPKKWFYPPFLDGLEFDLPALRDALNKPLDIFRLYLSRATLVVVPANLVEHWKTQIIRHTKPGQLRVCVLIDQKNAPKVQDLAWNYDVVITTFSRLSSEWSYKETSILMGVHWLRIILDEGHTLGVSLSLTNKLQMAVSMHASRRWVLTGTPTPHTPNSQVAHLQPMLKYLHEEVYGSCQKAWETGILKPFEAGCEEGRIRLLELLLRCMISARKSDLCTIPPCLRKVVLLDFTQKHAESYNELVATVRRNILMADWNDPSHVESLLNPKQWKFRSTTIRNVRLSCCVAGHIKVESAGEDIQETMDILAQDGLEPLSWDYAVIKNALLVGGTCSRCGEWCRLPIITPCKHLLCLDCVAMDREKCTYPGCGNPYKMQSPEDLTRPENPNPKWPVPQDLIELQPSYKQDNWDPDWQATSSSKVAYLVERLKSMKAGGPNDELVDDIINTAQTDFLEKAIVFSQFLEHIHVIESQLLKAGIKVAGLYSPMHSANKLKSLWSFQNERDCTVLLMDGSAALGLDLSFVTHVFLMEPIWDRSVEEQVVSRAHRMGATRPILVETLAMRGTIEEQMIQFLQRYRVTEIPYSSLL
ncbi:hypothetical protein KP509_04G109900 [Ceratopteris richardii]|uniref:Uncharacterized protein n=1 Tax=Ceratopteris richardii TaxID=49495 RepID=A0A8T2V3H7_CERRI|nr:hypothetical protein KP509_04G109900 [Ceratopteris richardii]